MKEMISRLDHNTYLTLILCFTISCANPADRYQIVFYPVVPDARVRYPSHVRRFKIEMFTFVKDDVPLHEQVTYLRIVG